MSLTVSSKITGKSTKLSTSTVSSNATVTVSKKKLQEVVSMRILYTFVYCVFVHTQPSHLIQYSIFFFFLFACTLNIDSSNKMKY